MKQATSKLACALVVLGAIILSACSQNSGIPDNGDTTSDTSCTTPSGEVPCRTTTHLLHRSLVGNLFFGGLSVVDATQNRVTGHLFPTGLQPIVLQPSPDNRYTIVNNAGSQTLSIFDNLQEKVTATVQLGGSTESFVTSTNNQAGFAAVPNYSNGSSIPAGAIVRFNPTDGSLNTAIPFADVRILALDPAETHLLAFTDVDNDAHWVDLTTTDPSTGVPPYYTLELTDTDNKPITLSRPVAAFFLSTSTINKAYILSCGPECGGTEEASVTEIDLNSITLPDTPSTGATIPATVTSRWQVKGARIGFIDPNAIPATLYVAGSEKTLTTNDCAFEEERTTGCTTSGGNNVQDGWFTAIDLEAGNAGTPLEIQIGNGVKGLMRKIGSAFWVASRDCGVQSCITLVDPAAPDDTKLLPNGKLPGGGISPTPNGNATGISLAAIKGDSTDDVYTIEGGELFIYDQQGNPVVSDFTTDIKGQASDVTYIN